MAAKFFLWLLVTLSVFGSLSTYTESVVQANDFYYYWLEAETAEAIASPFEVGRDTEASWGKYIWVPEGSGNNWDGNGAAAYYVLDITNEGEYVIWGRVTAPSSGDDSFFVELDSGGINPWGIENGSSWLWDMVNNKTTQENPVKFYLTEGHHIVKIIQREDGTKLDRLLITNDFNYTPDLVSPTANNDAGATDQCLSVTINLIANDIDPDGTVNPSTTTITINPINGSFTNNFDGTIVYTPNPGFSGIDIFTYTVQDNDGQTSDEATVTVLVGNAKGLYYPPTGEGLDKQNQKSPLEAGLHPNIINELIGTASKWALWRHGYLIHVEGDFNSVTDVFSLRKTWHALTVGSAIKKGKIPSYDQKISVWLAELTGNDANATWWHVITQSAGFDYPYDGFPDYEPGEMWTYSDYHPVYLNHALAKAYGKQDFYDNYEEVLQEAYFDAIGMEGWSTGIVYDSGSQMEDGIRLNLDLEDMGRLGLLVLSKGKWNGKELIPRWFAEELETKQTYGMKVNYNGPNDGIINLDPNQFPESPYGYMTWVNTDGDYYPGADTHWAFGRGAGGHFILWNSINGIVYAGVGVQTDPNANGIPHIIERYIDGLNPLVYYQPYYITDVNDDGIMNDSDLNLFSYAFGEIDCTLFPAICQCDTDDDNDIDGADIAVLVSDFGRADCP